MVASQPAAGSKVWMDVRTVLASLPERPPPVLAVMKLPEELQYDCQVDQHEYRRV